jgi:CheY-like chemotaxis protein
MVMSSHIRVLVIEDSKADFELMCLELKKAKGTIDSRRVDDYQGVFTALDEQEWDLILCDCNLPGFSPAKALEVWKEKGCIAPFILVSGIITESEATHLLQGGAVDFISKDQLTHLQPTVERRLREHYNRIELQQKIEVTDSTISLMDRADFSFHSLEEANNLAVFLARICPKPQLAIIGLLELLTNAVEHGNLGITYEDKTRLNEADAWDYEVLHRLSLPENAHKQVEVRYERRDGKIAFNIRDQGEGFDWSPYMKVDPARVFDNHGRGIAMACASSFDQVTYQGIGNEVVAVIHL